MAKKAAQLGQYYTEGQRFDLPEQNPESSEAWGSDLSYCVPCRGSHPALMTDVIAQQDWTIDFCYKPWYRNHKWWDRFGQKNFASLYRLGQSKSKKPLDAIQGAA
jgi:hypothetical protein